VSTINSPFVNFSVRRARELNADDGKGVALPVANTSNGRVTNTMFSKRPMVVVMGCL